MVPNARSRCSRGGIRISNESRPEVRWKRNVDPRLTWDFTCRKPRPSCCRVARRDVKYKKLNSTRREIIMSNIVIKIDTQRITDWKSFHNLFAEVFGFPGFYGRNMDAWIDCMS